MWLTGCGQCQAGPGGVRCGAAGGAGRRRQQLSGLPEGKQVVEPGQEAGEGRKDEGVQRRDYPGAGGMVIGLGAHVGREGGDVLGQGMGCGF